MKPNQEKLFIDVIFKKVFPSTKLDRVRCPINLIFTNYEILCNFESLYDADPRSKAHTEHRPQFFFYDMSQAVARRFVPPINTTDYLDNPELTQRLFESILSAALAVGDTAAYQSLLVRAFNYRIPSLNVPFVVSNPSLLPAALNISIIAIKMKFPLVVPKTISAMFPCTTIDIKNALSTLINTYKRIALDSKIHNESMSNTIANIFYAIEEEMVRKEYYATTNNSDLVSIIINNMPIKY